MFELQLRDEARGKKKKINSNSNYDVVITNCYDNSNYSKNTIHSIYYVNNIFNCISVILAVIIRILLIGMDF